MKAILIAIGLSACAGSGVGAESGLDKWVAAHEPQPEMNRHANLKGIPMRTHLMKAALAAPLFYGVPHASHAQPYAKHITRAADETMTAEIQQATPAPTAQTPPSPASARGRLDAALAAYKDAVSEYAVLLNKSAAGEAVAKRSQIKARLTGDTVNTPPEIQAAYDAKDIAEAKMNAAEKIMNAAIADMGKGE